MRNRIPAGFFLAGVFLALASPTWATLSAGAGLVILGEAIRTWASGYIHKGKRLACDGPYAHVRHPLYTGSFLLGLGISVMGASPFFVALYVVLFPVAYLGLIRAEEKNLEAAFGQDFAAYRKNVPRLLPRWTGWSARNAGSEAFRWSGVWRNKEYNAWMGIVAVTAVLYLKMAAGG